MEAAQHHEQFIHRAIELARLGLGRVSPNPLVGCVIVYEGKIIAEGWHQQYGASHAEVNAVNTLENKELLKESTVYVNLEPCAHQGKTPPCADMLVEQKVKRVVIANIDPNPLVAGKGLQKLRDAGIEVIENILADEGRVLNRRFFTFIEKQRPYIILKWAQTADGFMAREDYSSKWISNEQSRQLLHKWRAEEDAVIVGSNTAKHDNPQLNVRDWKGRDPLRIVVDRKLSIPKTLHLFDAAQRTVCYNLLKNESNPNLEFVKVSEENFMNDLLKDLHGRGIQSLIVEGGATLLNLFIQAGLWDEARVFESNKKFDKGIKAPDFSVEAIEQVSIADDKLFYFKNMYLWK
jgi:diaminohydroxyphosphoribosylaminopyrimidine deaminase / 5-amino-6-(5-phosphoribosylamino)uracil reductase